MRTFEFSDAKSHKFWSIDLGGSSFTVTYGKIGTAGQTQTKSFPTAEKAQVEADKLIREKTGKGYVEKTAKAASSESEVLEKAIIADPHDVAAWSAYADLLLEQGDPRGEFMRVQLALEDEKLSKAERDKLKKQEAALLKKHQKDWLGEIAEDIVERTPTKWPIPAVQYEFRRGWLHTLFYPKLTVNAVRRLNGSSQAKLLQRLLIQGTASEALTGSTDEYADDFYTPGKDVPADLDSHDGASFHALAKCPHLNSVRTLWMSEMLNDKLAEPGLEPSCHIPGEFAYHFVKQMPNVEELRLHAHDVDMKKIFAMPLPELRHLEVYHSKDYACDKLAANKSLAKLETIRLYAKAIDICDDDPKPYLRLKQLKEICN
jgi:uncharacterized protein (TIGR02996 family)